MKAYAVYGPPGTGKTTEMISRVSNVVKHGIPEAGVYFLSYTKAAAQEALSRVGADRAENFSTIHSLCYKLTKVYHGAVVDYRKLAELSRVTGVRITGRNIDEEDLGEGDQYLQIMSKAENLLLPYDEVYETSDRPGSFDEFIMFCNSYEEWKKSYGYVDFNDMLKRVLGKNIKFGGTHLIIDEAQDLSPLQWRVVNRLIELSDPEEVHVCGDDDQSIHVWSGADPHGMDEFGKMYDADVKILSQSWRVPRLVHNEANSIITQVSRRVDKTYLPRPADGEVEFSFDTRLIEFDENEDTMILGRTHSVLREVEDVLRSDRIPFKKNGGISMFSNKYANSIRAVNKANRGESISDTEQKALLSTLVDPILNGAVQEGDIGKLKGHDWRDIIAVPGFMYQYYDYVDVDEEPKITLSTIHGSKGKEASRVILLTKLTGRVIESMNSTTQRLDDEHRVFYVGATRAKNRLDIIQDSDGYSI